MAGKGLQILLAAVVAKLGGLRFQASVAQVGHQTGTQGGCGGTAAQKQGTPS